MLLRRQGSATDPRDETFRDTQGLALKGLVDGMKAAVMVLAAVVVATSGVMADEMPKGLWRHPHPLTHHTNRVERTAGRRLLKAATALPTRYDSRDIDGQGTTYLTPVRNQNPYGTCWAFASMVGIEYLMNRDEGITADLSVNNLVNLHGFAAAYNQGGLPDFAVAVFLREDGPVTAALDPYKRPGLSVRERGVRIPRKVAMLPRWTTSVPGDLMTTQLESVKRGVMTYGPLTISYYHSDSYLKGANYYYTGAKGANHSVAVVGWDDDYPAANFKTPPPANGAFIIRNSWGTSWGEKGYFYLSYYDTSLCRDGNIAWARLSDGSDYGHVYQLDPYGYVMSYGTDIPSDTAFGANVFTAWTDETLTAFGFYALAENTTYEVTVVIDPQFETDGSLSGTMTPVKKGVCADVGFEVLDFDREVAVGAVTNFAIAVKLTTPNYAYPIAVMCNAKFSDGSPYLERVVPMPGVSYFGAGETTADAEWEEMSGDGDFFCCKVYAKAKVPSATSSGETSVPYRWLDLYSNSTALYANCLTNYYYGAYNALGEHLAANGVRIEESFARGLDPDNAAETNLLATISFDAGGKPVIGVSPKNTALWDYTILGSRNLRDWAVRSDTDLFFKVNVTPK